MREDDSFLDVCSPIPFCLRLCAAVHSSLVAIKGRKNNIPSSLSVSAPFFTRPSVFFGGGGRLITSRPREQFRADRANQMHVAIDKLDHINDFLLNIVDAAL